VGDRDEHCRRPRHVRLGRGLTASPRPRASYMSAATLAKNRFDNRSPYYLCSIQTGALIHSATAPKLSGSHRFNSTSESSIGKYRHYTLARTKHQHQIQNPQYLHLPRVDQYTESLPYPKGKVTNVFRIRIDYVNLRLLFHSAVMPFKILPLYINEHQQATRALCVVLIRLP
jgi:hypothetical protein